MYARSGLAKAKLETFDKKSPNEKLEFPFNPTNLDITRGAGFGSSPSEATSVNDYGSLKFEGAKADSISMTIILDTSEPDIYSSKYAKFMMQPVIASSNSTSPAKSSKGIPYFGGAVNTASVTDQINTLIRMTKMTDDDKKKKKSGSKDPVYPRLLKFTWGDQIQFSGAIDKLSFKILLFDSDGIPKRAEVSLGMVGVYGDYSKPAADLVFGEGESKVKSSQSF